MNWVTKIGLTHHIHLTSRQPTTTSSSISKTFCRENASTISKMQKILHQILKHRFLCYRSKLILHWQTCIDYNRSFLINKDIFGSSYNGLKFMVQNPNYVCTNLISVALEISPLALLACLPFLEKYFISSEYCFLLSP